MRIAIATKEGGLEDQVSPVIGRAPTFTVVETEDGKIVGSSVLQNQFAQAQSGAGIQVARILVDENVDAVIGGSFGPNLANLLSQSGVEMYQFQAGVAREAVEQLTSGELSSLADAGGNSLDRGGMNPGGVGGMGGMGSGGMGNRGGGMGSAGAGGMGTRRGGRGMRGSGSSASGNLSGANSSSGQVGRQERLKALEDRISGLEKQVSEIMEILEGLRGE